MKIRYLLLSLVVALPGFAQQIQKFSGDGQLVNEQFLTTAPLVARIIDASGRGVANVPVTWTIPVRGGSLRPGPATTDADGYAKANVLATDLPPGISWDQTTVTATSQYGSVDFYVTTVSNRLDRLPTVQVRREMELSGPAGSTIPNAFSIVVAAGGIGATGKFVIPNVGVRIVQSAEDFDPNTTPGATCDGTLLTNDKGEATCNLILNKNPGLGSIYAVAGEFRRTAGIPFAITKAEPCNVSLAPSFQSFGGNGGSGSFQIISTNTCVWNAATTFPWITLSGTTSGQGNSSVAFTVAANTGGARTGLITVANATFTITQGGQGAGGPLSFSVSSTLPSGAVGSSYSLTLGILGGTPPYSWIATGVPAGLQVNSSTGLLSGTPTAAGNYTIALTVRDAAGTTASQNFALTVNPQGATGGTSLSFTITSFPSGTVGTDYKQPIGLSGGCSNPFAGPRVEVVSGALPPGLTIQSPTASISLAGTPSAAGTYQFALRASDPCGASAVRDFSISITAPGATPFIVAAPGSLQFSAPAGSTTAPTQNLTVTTGDVSLSFNATSTVPWLTLQASGPTTPATVTASVNTVGLSPGIYQGFVSLNSQAPNSPLNLPVSLTVTAPVTATAAVNPGALTFNYELGAAAPAAQSIAFSSTTPVQYTSVVAMTSGGQWLSVTNGAGTSPASIGVQVSPGSLAVGTYSGTITITSGAINSPQVIPVVLNIRQPGPQVTQVVNGASFLPGPIAPGEILTILGNRIGPAILAPFRLTAAGTLDTLVSDTRVWFDDQPAPILHASAAQTTVVVPYTVAGRASVRMQVEYGGARSTARDLVVADSAPGLFTVGGSTQGAILNQDFTLNTPANGTHPGGIVLIYATGEGALNPSGQAGAIGGATPSRPILPVRVFIAGREAEVLYAGTAAGLPLGLMQINARVPEGTSPNATASVVVTVGNGRSQDVTMYVSQ